MTLPLLVTSINPFAKLAHQLRCLEAWAALGFEVRTANVAREAERLVAAGLAPSAILKLDDADTGAALYGKPLPRIAPLLARLAAADPARAVLLVNSDIYPAMRSAEAVRFWAAQAPAMALTREECATLESHRFAVSAPYRNGLDAFLFSPWALKATNMMLAEIPVAARMAFGIPGWDFLLGAVVRSPFVGGRLLDSGVLLHETHSTTYANVDAFAPYLPAMHDLKAATTYTATEAAHEFHRIIVADCAAASSLSRLVKAQFYRAPKPDAPSDAARSIALRLCELAPFVGWNTDFAALVALADRQIRAGQERGLSADNSERGRRRFRDGAELLPHWPAGAPLRRGPAGRRLPPCLPCGRRAAGAYLPGAHPPCAEARNRHRHNPRRPRRAPRGPCRAVRDGACGRGHLQRRALRGSGAVLPERRRAGDPWRPLRPFRRCP